MQIRVAGACSSNPAPPPNASMKRNWCTASAAAGINATEASLSGKVATICARGDREKRHGLGSKTYTFQVQQTT